MNRSGSPGALALDEHAAQDLARRRLRNRVDELDVANALVVRHRRADERHHLLGGDRAACHDEGFRHLAGVVVRHRNHGRVGNPWMLQQQRLELGRRHLEAFHLDQLLQPIDDREITVGVDHADITRAQPAVRVERACSCFRVVEVALHYLRTPHPHLAALADVDVAARLGVHDPTLGARQQ